MAISLVAYILADNGKHRVGTLRVNMFSTNIIQMETNVETVRMKLLDNEDSNNNDNTNIKHTIL